MLNCLKRSISFAWHSATRPAGITPKPIASLPVICKRHESNYEAYPTYDTPSPYKSRHGIRADWTYKVYTGGVLPRPEGKWEDLPLPRPEYTRKKADMWTGKKALFGQNDYIDILGDGTVHPWQLIRAPMWVKGYKGNELQRIIRQLKVQGAYLREMFPSKHHELKKQLFFLYKKLNRRRHTPYWGGYRRWSRIDKPLKRF